MLKKIIKYIFCISDEVKNNKTKILPLSKHIPNRILMILFLCFVIFISYGYIRTDGFIFKTLTQMLLYLLMIRLLAKDFIDHTLHLLFYKKDIRHISKKKNYLYKEERN